MYVTRNAEARKANLYCRGKAMALHILSVCL